MVKVVVAAPIHPDAIKMLEDAGFEVVYREYPSVDELKSLVRDADALVVRSKPKVRKDVIDAGSKLKAIARAGVGLDNIDVEEAKKRGIAIFNAPAAPSRSVAELAIGLIIAVTRKIAYADRSLREGRWVKKECLGTELNGKTIGIVGFGRIGREVAKIARYGLGMRVIFYDVVEPPQDVVKALDAVRLDLDEVFRRADVVSLHVPLLDSTYHLVNESRLKLMKKTAILINTSRGGIIDTDALIKALREGWIAGAGLDVYEEEPLPEGHPLTKLNNVVLTPHIGASTVEAQARAGVEVASKLVEFFQKLQLQH
jgi:D-3-phosphoglycerate dehydrogenase